MVDSFIRFIKPPGAAAAGYDADPRNPGAIWRMQIPAGDRRDVGLVASATTIDSLGVSSNNPNVIRNEDIRTRMAGGMKIISLTGRTLGTTMLEAGLAPSPFSVGGRTLPPIGNTVAGAQFINVSLQVQVTRSDGSMPGDGNYSGVPAEGQIDATACWAACFTWWLKALPDRPQLSQMTLLGQAAGIWGAGGTMSLSAIKSLYERQNAKISCDIVAPSAFNQYIVPSKFPQIVGFQAGPIGGHVNVIHAIDSASSTVTAMEPWFPDPSADPNYSFSVAAGLPLFSRKSDGAPFRFTGQHVKRPLSYYTSRPLNGNLLICRPW